MQNVNCLIWPYQINSRFIQSKVVQRTDIRLQDKLQFLYLFIWVSDVTCTVYLLLAAFLRIQVDGMAHCSNFFTFFSVIDGLKAI